MQYSQQWNLPVEIRVLQHIVHRVHTELLVPVGQRHGSFASAGSGWQKWGWLYSLAGADFPAAGVA
jgi:hypothetical protein